MNKTADVMQRFLRQENREQTAKEQQAAKPPTEEDFREELLSDISRLTDISLNQIRALPKDIQEDIIDVFSRDIGTVNNSKLAEQITAALGGKPPENHLKTVEELVEGNANSIDGVINNLPSAVERDINRKPSLEERIFAAREKNGKERESHQEQETPNRER